MTVSQIRSVDRIAIEEFGMSGLVLMENAGRGAADVIARFASHAKTTIMILCGVGNNGGDGFVIARHLHAQGFRVEVFVVGDRDRYSPDAKANAAILDKTSVEVHPLSESEISPSSIASPSRWNQALRSTEIVVDALLGTGAKGAPRGAMASAIESVNAIDVLRIAVDIPTGLDATTGAAHSPTFRAHHTLTFVAPKPGFSAPWAREYIGEVHVLPIGVPPEVISRASLEGEVDREHIVP